MEIEPNNSDVKVQENLNSMYKTCPSDKIVLVIETDGLNHILQIAYNMYDQANNLIQSKDFYVYDGIHSKPFYPTIKEEDIISQGISPSDASNIVTQDINNTNILIGHNINSFDLLNILKTYNNLSFDFIVNYILNEKYQQNRKEKNITIDTVANYQPHLVPKIKELLEQIKNE